MILEKTISAYLKLFPISPTDSSTADVKIKSNLLKIAESLQDDKAF